mmetsp:Transcript_9391/g.17598  ORF Transcript_9391/g.17598 Transcript_9391/m.17598 type:complete len:238 (+) Transcript_9391:1415-2128(+)
MGRERGSPVGSDLLREPPDEADAVGSAGGMGELRAYPLVVVGVRCNLLFLFPRHVESRRRRRHERRRAAPPLQLGEDDGSYHRPDVLRRSRPEGHHVGAPGPQRAGPRGGGPGLGARGRARPSRRGHGHRLRLRALREEPDQGQRERQPFRFQGRPDRLRPQPPPSRVVPPLQRRFGGLVHLQPRRQHFGRVLGQLPRRRRPRPVVLGLLLPHPRRRRLPRLSHAPRPRRAPLSLPR